MRGYRSRRSSAGGRTVHRCHRPVRHPARSRRCSGSSAPRATGRSARSWRAVSHAPLARCGRRGMHVRRRVRHQRARARGGTKGTLRRAGPARLQRLTAEQTAEDLSSPRLAGNQRLERAFDNNPAIHIGESGEAVRLLQETLVDDGFALPRSTRSTGALDGALGQETFDVLREFQAKHGLDADGVAGRQTLRAMDAIAAARPLLKPRPGQPPATVELPGVWRSCFREAIRDPLRFPASAGFPTSSGRHQRRMRPTWPGFRTSS